MLFTVFYLGGRITDNQQCWTYSTHRSKENTHDYIISVETRKR
jgi:hypothetical protein